MSDTQTDPNVDPNAQPTLSWDDVGNDPVVADEVPAEAPEQGRGSIPLLRFGEYQVRLPDDLSKAWQAPKKDKNGVTRITLKLDASNPLVVVGGPHDGDILTATVSTIPRPRGQQKQQISDMFYLLRTSFADQTLVSTLRDWKNAIDAHAGQVFRVDVGGTANCREDKVRYIETQNPETGGNATIEDPSGTKGCGKRMYTRDINKLRDEAGNPPEHVYCPQCGAVLRVFNQIERYLPPLAS